MAKTKLLTHMKMSLKQLKQVIREEVERLNEMPRTPKTKSSFEQRMQAKIEKGTFNLGETEWFHKLSTKYAELPNGSPAPSWFNKGPGFFVHLTHQGRNPVDDVPYDQTWLTGTGNELYVEFPDEATAELAAKNGRYGKGVGPPMNGI